MKKLSITRQLKAALNEIEELKKNIESLEKKFKSEESLKTYNYTARAEAESQLNQVHTLLDCVPNPPARKTSDDYPKELQLVTRISVWLATR